jgi:hypothetical protein
MIGLQENITFKEDTHQYFDRNGEEYTSVSRVIRKVEPEFDRHTISLAMARKKAKEDGISVDRAQEIILSEWDQKKDSSINHGNFIHGNIEAYLLSGTCDPRVIGPAKRIARFLSPFQKYFPEALVYSSKYKVAGQSDLVVQRQRTEKGIHDFYDFKTNEQKGIYFDSIKRKDGQVEKHYNRFLKEPLSHLEHCNYNTYALQLSLYAFVSEETFNFQIGRLGIIFIGKSGSIRLYPVPYMKLEAKVLLEYHKSLTEASWD